MSRKEAIKSVITKASKDKLDCANYGPTTTESTTDTGHPQGTKLIRKKALTKKMALERQSNNK